MNFIFQAWDKKGRFRAIGYMRALAIWAIQYALQRKNDLKDGNE